MNKFQYPVEEVHFNGYESFDAVLAIYIECDARAKALMIYDDVLRFVQRKISSREFLTLHPEFIYRWNAFRDLADQVRKDLHCFGSDPLDDDDDHIISGDHGEPLDTQYLLSDKPMKKYNIYTHKMY